MHHTSAEDAEDEDGEAGNEEPTASAGKAGAAKKKRKEKLFKVSAAVLAWKVNVRAWQVKPQARSDGAACSSRAAPECTFAFCGCQCRRSV